MKEHPLLLNTEMVKAVLDGNKTQTRTLIKLPDTIGEDYCSADWELGNRPASYNENEFAFIDMAHPTDSYPWYVKCPWQVGDLMYVREKMYTTGDEILRYFADSELRGPETSDERAWIWKRKVDTTIPSTNMPKWAARIWLEITAIRVERVQDINKMDALHEGVKWEAIKIMCMQDYGERAVPHEAKIIPLFQELWESLYPGSWERNDWVFVREFKRIEYGNIAK